MVTDPYFVNVTGQYIVNVKALEWGGMINFGRFLNIKITIIIFAKMQRGYAHEIWPEFTLNFSLSLSLWDGLLEVRKLISIFLHTREQFDDDEISYFESSFEVDCENSKVILPSLNLCE